MTDGLVAVTLYLLLDFIEFLLKIVYKVCETVTYVIKLIIQYVLNVNMTETPKKRKTNSNDQSNQTVGLRGKIDANWKKFLSSNLIMDKKVEKPEPKDQFSGTFRRARRKKPKSDIPNTVQDIKNLNLESTTNLPTNSEKKNKITKFLAMDCEMVGVGYDGHDHMLARVSLVNRFGDCIYDKFVKAREEVIDYRTDISGVRKEDLLNGEEFTTVQKEVSDIIKGRILVGHSLKNDLSVLFLSHPKRNIRDTSRYKPFRKVTKGSTPSLKRLAKEILGIDIQHGEHSSVEDARAAMQLYCTVAKNWENTMSEKRGYNRKIVDE